MVIYKILYVYMCVQPSKLFGEMIIFRALSDSLFRAIRKQAAASDSQEQRPFILFSLWRYAHPHTNTHTPTHRQTHKHTHAQILINACIYIEHAALLHI